MFPAIQIDLRQPSMHHGRKAFDRLLWACMNVLAESIAWLFCDPENNDICKWGSCSMVAPLPLVEKLMSTSNQQTGR